MSYIAAPVYAKPYVSIKRNDISDQACQLVRLRKVHGKNDEQSMIFNWAITSLRKEIEHSMFPAKAVAEKFIERMELYSMNDVANSWKWSVAKDAGEYVLDAIIWVNENFNKATGKMYVNSDGKYRKKPPYVYKTNWIF